MKMSTVLYAKAFTFRRTILLVLSLEIVYWHLCIGKNERKKNNNNNNKQQEKTLSI